jgi:hypothetical protein
MNGQEKPFNASDFEERLCGEQRKRPQLAGSAAFCCQAAAKCCQKNMHFGALLCIYLQRRKNWRKGRRAFIYADLLDFEGMGWSGLERPNIAFSLR